jgi:hypothetical protein
MNGLLCIIFVFWIEDVLEEMEGGPMFAALLQRSPMK